MSEQIEINLVTSPNVRQLEMDQFEFLIASRVILSPCPHCGTQSPFYQTKQNINSGNYIGYINCIGWSKGCMSMSYAGAETKAEARLKAVKTWEMRNGVLEGHQAVAFVEAFNAKEREAMLEPGSALADGGKA